MYRKRLLGPFTLPKWKIRVDCCRIEPSKQRGSCSSNLEPGSWIQPSKQQKLESSNEEARSWIQPSKQRGSWKLERTWKLESSILKHGSWNVESRKLESSNPEHGSWNVDAGIWIQESRTRKRVLSKPFPSKSSVPGLGGAQHQPAAEGCFKTPAAGRAFR